MSSPTRSSPTTARATSCARIEAALRDAGKDPARPTLDDLAGWTSSTRAAGRPRSSWPQLLPAAIDTELLDVGSGLGGPARFLAATRGYRVVGIDLTPEYVAVANELTRRCGLAGSGAVPDRRRARLPFADGRLRRRLHAARGDEYRGQGRALPRDGARAPAGRHLRIYDILQGPGGPVRYPTPWSADGTTSFLVDRAALERPSRARVHGRAGVRPARGEPGLVRGPCRGGCRQRRPAAARASACCSGRCSPKRSPTWSSTCARSASLPTFRARHPQRESLAACSRSRADR